MKKSCFLSFFLSLFLISCSNFQNSTSLSLRLSGRDFSRSAARDATGGGNENYYHVTAAILGDYEESQSAFIPREGECIFTFEYVPVGYMDGYSWAFKDEDAMIDYVTKEDKVRFWAANISSYSNFLSKYGIRVN